MEVIVECLRVNTPNISHEKPKSTSLRFLLIIINLFKFLINLSLIELQL